MTTELGYCGDNCSACPRYIATALGDTSLLKSVRDLYVKVGHRPPDTEIEALKCGGCRANKDCAHPALKMCATLRKLDNCGQCDTYPCGRMNELFARTNAFKEKVRGVAGEKMFRMLDSAFFRKKEYLDKERESASRRKRA
ncbi:MAG: DUF3795 domain-containing protein [Endomicrobiales bacterium]|nr:DUF3795 domain-containing protein [Endomicrobiales bacterium]